MHIMFLQLSGQNQMPVSPSMEQSEIGQWYISGTVKDYQTNENLPAVTVIAHAIDPYSSYLSLLPPQSVIADQNGFFRIKIHSQESINLTFSFIGYSNLTIMNINSGEYNKEIGLESIYLRSYPLFNDDFRNPNRKERRQIKSEQRKRSTSENSTDIGWGGIPNEYIDKHCKMERISMCYPGNGARKKLLYYEGALIIDFSELKKTDIP